MAARFSGGLFMGFSGDMLHPDERLPERMVFTAWRSCTFFFIANFAVPNTAMDRRTPGKLLERNLSGVTPDAILVSNDNVLRAVCWFFKRDDVKVLEKPRIHLWVET